MEMCKQQKLFYQLNFKQGRDPYSFPTEVRKKWLKSSCSTFMALVDKYKPTFLGRQIDKMKDKIRWKIHSNHIL